MKMEENSEFIGLSVNIIGYSSEFCRFGLNLRMRGRERRQILSGDGKLPHRIYNTSKEKLKKLRIRDKRV